MLEIIIDPTTTYDESSETFREVGGGVYYLEHSLYTIAKWEQKYNIPFLRNNPRKTNEQMLDYFKMMTSSKDFDPLQLTPRHIEEITNYMIAPMSATTIASRDSGPAQLQTADTLYANLFMAGMAIECEHWHFNRFIKTLEVISEKNSPAKKMTHAEIREQNIRLNAQRKAELNTKG